MSSKIYVIQGRFICSQELIVILKRMIPLKRLGGILIFFSTNAILRHWRGIVNWIFYKISNGILEGFNSIFHTAKAKARCYKRADTIKAIIYLLPG